jgi:hypothetical protein
MVTMTGLITDTSDHRLIRQSTAAIASRYGHDYYAERARDGGHIAELWAARPGQAAAGVRRGGEAPAGRAR